MTRRLFQRIAVCTCLCVLSLQAFAQNRVISISAVNEPIAEVMKKIEKSSGFTFFYNDSTVDKNTKVSISAKDEEIEVVLKRLFSGSGTSFSIMDRNIILSPSSDTSSPITPPQTFWHTDRQRYCL